MKNIQVTVRRYNQQQGEYTQAYTVPVEDREIVSVMNLLEYIYENLDSTLALFIMRRVARRLAENVW